MRRATAALALFLAAWLGVDPVPFPATPAAGQTAPLPEFSSGMAFSHVRRLAGRIGPRPARSRAYRRAVRYVRGQLTSLGYATSLQRFRLPQGGRSWNVVASSGAEPIRLLIGAHLDTVGGSPGGNDNASGVAVLLEVARILAGTVSTVGLALVAFGAEEFQPVGGHHIGSQVFVNRMTGEERAELDLMVSADMIGKPRSFIVGRLRGTPAGGAREVARAARASGSRASVRILGDISDHGPFALAGMAAAFLWTGSEPNHHMPTDRPRNVARRALGRAGRALLELIDRVLGSP
jgi:aminopeptidase YwaD